MFPLTILTTFMAVLLLLGCADSKTDRIARPSYNATPESRSLPRTAAPTVSTKLVPYYGGQIMEYAVPEAERAVNALRGWLSSSSSASAASSDKGVARDRAIVTKGNSLPITDVGDDIHPLSRSPEDTRQGIWVIKTQNATYQIEKRTLNIYSYWGK